MFSSGGNLAGFAADASLVQKHFASERFPAVFALLGELGKPSLCAANGHVLAGALGLALACDLIVAKDGARFGTPEINVGLFPFMIMALIYRNVGRKKTNELMLLGEQISAQEAERIGIVNRVVPAAEFDAAVADWAGRLAAKSPVLMKLGKDAMFRQQDMAYADAVDFLRSQLTPGLLDRGHPGGRDRVLRETRSGVEGALRSAQPALVSTASRGVDSWARRASAKVTRRWRSSSQSLSRTARSPCQSERVGTPANTGFSSWARCRL